MKNVPAVRPTISHNNSYCPRTQQEWYTSWYSYQVVNNTRQLALLSAIKQRWIVVAKSSL